MQRTDPANSGSSAREVPQVILLGSGDCRRDPLEIDERGRNRSLHDPSAWSNPLSRFRPFFARTKLIRVFYTNLSHACLGVTACHSVKYLPLAILKGPRSFKTHRDPRRSQAERDTGGLARKSRVDATD